MEHQYQQQQDLVFAQQEEQAYFAEYDRAFDQVTYQADYYDAMYEQEEEQQQYDDDDDDDMMMEEEYNNYYDNAENNMDIMNEQYEEEEQEEGVEDEETENIDNGYDYQRDSLLHLIVGVQSYLSDANALHQDRNDSPLVDLQYKMYTYLKQRACDMGVDMEAAATHQQF